ncbi:hypothetical protein ANSO36C_15890 [Nostoc cf. commune SO-36]|uniref:Uncharacterized protein n=1 Tax=Nostoc cf. commune SO-36 TaxID=449208 RepID=A0ABM7YYN4_NOSCO|nr:hypothetical protein [Nostoc commune]BDI15787.1 hypothetical protein ANSO36C_15890 [Nostoc cf. commune SO-36]
MLSANQQPSSKPASNLDLFPIPPLFLLQIGTASILLLLITGKTTVRALEAVGEASEELFRGDRLPILDFPDEHDINQDEKIYTK